MWGEEPIMDPSDDQPIPAEPAGSAPVLPEHFHLARGQPDPRFTAQGPSTWMHVSASQRPGDHLDTSSNQEKRTSKDPEETGADVDLADFGIPERNGAHIRLDMTDMG